MGVAFVASAAWSFQKADRSPRLIPPERDRPRERDARFDSGGGRPSASRGCVDGDADDRAVSDGIEVAAQDRARAAEARNGEASGLREMTLLSRTRNLHRRR